MSIDVPSLGTYKATKGEMSGYTIEIVGTTVPITEEEAGHPDKVGFFLVMLDKPPGGEFEMTCTEWQASVEENGLVFDLARK